MEKTGKKHHRTFLIVTLVALSGFGAYYYVTHEKRIYAKTIVKLGGSSNYLDLMNFDQDYLKAWAKGLVRLKAQFVYQGSNYFTIGGKKVPPNTPVDSQG